jgi:hypothetical protein
MAPPILSKMSQKKVGGQCVTKVGNGVCLRHDGFRRRPRSEPSVFFGGFHILIGSLLLANMVKCKTSWSESLYPTMSFPRPSSSKCSRPKIRHNRGNQRRAIHHKQTVLSQGLSLEQEEFCLGVAGISDEHLVISFKGSSNRGIKGFKRRTLGVSCLFDFQEINFKEIKTSAYDLLVC